MIKEERHELILELVSTNNFVKVSDIQKQLNVTDMTVRRDLQELEDKGKLLRVHGGAKSIEGKPDPIELSHTEKLNIHLQEKKEVAQQIAQQINDGDTIFLGAGTTIELVYEYFNANQVKIITNSFPLFNKFKNDNRVELVLVGGTYRAKTGAFVGTLTNDTVENIHVMKAFIGVNGIQDGNIYNSNEDEGVTQRKILQSSETKYIVADHFKLDKRDFYKFYNLEDADYLITDLNISLEDKERYEKYIQIISQ